MSDEQDMQAMMEKINQLKNSQGLTTPHTPVNPNPMPVNQNYGEFDNQGTITDAAKTAVPQTPVTNDQLQAVNVSPQNVCPQCNMAHPPIPEGKTCPNATIKQQTGVDMDDGEVNKYLVQWRNIVISQINALNIKEWEKEFQQITMHLQKYFDEKKQNV